MPSRKSATFAADERSMLTIELAYCIVTHRIDIITSSFSATSTICAYRRCAPNVKTVMQLDPDAVGPRDPLRSQQTGAQLPFEVDVQLAVQPATSDASSRTLMRNSREQTWKYLPQIACRKWHSCLRSCLHSCLKTFLAGQQ